jgi:hypothetical protein
VEERWKVTRSYRKPYFTLTPKWDKFCEKSFRQRVKRTLQQFDPDADWDELNMSMKGLEEYGTKFGFDVPPDESEDQGIKDEYEKAQRK